MNDTVTEPSTLMYSDLQVSTAQPPSSPSASTHPRVLERSLSPSPDRLEYRLMEPSTPHREVIGVTYAPSMIGARAPIRL
jgi:hypothetical protein